jgi:hypothetical protein
VNATTNGRGWTGSSLLSIAHFLKSLTTTGAKDGRVLAGDHAAALASAMDHLRQADALMSSVIDAHAGNMTARDHGTVDEPEVADPMPMKGTSGTKSNRWIFSGGRA